MFDFSEFQEFFFPFLDIYLADPYLPLTIYNILIPIVYAVLVWHVIKEDKTNSQVIDLQMRPPGALAKEVMYIISKVYINEILATVI